MFIFEETLIIFSFAKFNSLVVSSAAVRGLTIGREDEIEKHVQMLHR